LDCIKCHSYTTQINFGPLAGGTRRAVANELKTSGTRNHKGTAVGSDATKWDCIVCHMEGDYATGGTSTSHANGVLDFRDPDTGTQVKTVTWSGNTYNTSDAGGRYKSTLTNFTTSRFKRDLGVPLESDPEWLHVAAIQMNLCLKCHDNNGAANSNAWTKNSAGTVVGTAMQPFGLAVGSTATQYWVSATLKTAAGNTTGAVMNVFSQLSSGNASYHPVRGRQNNGFASGSMMKTPWGNATKSVARSNTIYGFLISCFDCHAGNGATGPQNSTVVAHGNGTTGAVVAMRAKSAFNTAAAGNNNICTVCHSDNYTLTTQHGTGSALQTGNNNMNASTFGLCRNCHSGGTDTIGSRAVDAHGANGRASDGNVNLGTGRPYSFFRGNTNLVDWLPGTCNGGCTVGTYAPGGLY
jgi:hypothetical protein